MEEAFEAESDDDNDEWKYNYYFLLYNISERVPDRFKVKIFTTNILTV